MESKWSDHRETRFVKKYHKARKTMKLDLDVFIEDDCKCENNPINNLNLLVNATASNGNKKVCHHPL